MVVKESTTTITTNNNNDNNIITTVAIIGGGPGGMFLVHALEQLKKEATTTGNELPVNVHVTCYEKSSQPGGIWRSASASSSSSGSDHRPVDGNDNTVTTTTTTTTTSSIDMYDALWTNGCSYSIEMYDYTLFEHFNGQPTTVYLPRQDLLEYMIGRVTKHNGIDFFDRFFQFNSEIIYVKYDDTQFKFIIHIQDTRTKEIRIKLYDKCIWACGENGKPKIPYSLITKLRSEGYNGRIIHSSDTTNLEQDVRNKRILVIGGAFSAEDITLQSIKLGVEQVYICTRLCNNEITWTTKWPENKVITLLEQEIRSCCNDNGRTIQFREISWTFDGYKDYTNNAISNEIHNIDTIILCTGYNPNLDFLDESLQQGYPGGEEYFTNDFTFDAPNNDNWTMQPGLFTELTGDVPLANKIRYLTWRVHPNFYRGILISNPNMMFLSVYGSDHPLLATDVYARLLAMYITGLKVIPTSEQMQHNNRNEAIAMLHYPYTRYQMDKNYYNIVTYLPNFWLNDDGDEYGYPPVWDEAVDEYYILGAKQLAHIMQECNYPFQTGTIDKLNDKGLTMIQFGYQCYEHRSKLIINNDNVDDNNNRRTYRDYNNPDDFYSLHTGTRAIKLQEKWLDINIDNNNNSTSSTTRRQQHQSKLPVVVENTTTTTTTTKSIETTATTTKNDNNTVAVVVTTTSPPKKPLTEQNIDVLKTTSPIKKLSIE